MAFLIVIATMVLALPWTVMRPSKENLRSEGRRKDPVSGDAQLSSDFFHGICIV
jgi:hypothetical protein